MVKDLREEVEAREAELAKVRGSVDDRVAEEVERLSAEFSAVEETLRKMKEENEVDVFGRDAARKEAEELSSEVLCLDGERKRLVARVDELCDQILNDREKAEAELKKAAEESASIDASQSSLKRVFSPYVSGPQSFSFFWPMFSHDFETNKTSFRLNYRGDVFLTLFLGEGDFVLCESCAFRSKPGFVEKISLIPLLFLISFNAILLYNYACVYFIHE